MMTERRPLSTWLSVGVSLAIAVSLLTGHCFANGDEPSNSTSPTLAVSENTSADMPLLETTINPETKFIAANVMNLSRVGSALLPAHLLKNESEKAESDGEDADDYDDSADYESEDKADDGERAEFQSEAYRGIASGLRHLFDLFSQIQLTMSTSDHGVPEYPELVRFVRRNVQEMLDEMIKGLLPIWLEVSERGPSVSHQCFASQFRFLQALRSFEPWAIRMLDSWGKLPEGISSGTLSSFGVYDACLSIQTANERGQYCAVNIAPITPIQEVHHPNFYEILKNAAHEAGFPSNDTILSTINYFHFLKFRIGLCVPSLCSESDVKSLTHAVGEFLKMNITVNRCETREKLDLLGYPLIPLSFMGLVAVILFFGTLIDVVVIYARRNSSRADQWTHSLICKTSHSISVYSNVGRLFALVPARRESATPEKETIAADKWRRSSEQTDSGSSSLTCLDGLQVIAMLWTILSNTYTLVDLKILSGLLLVKDISRPLMFQFISSSGFSLDMLFFVAALRATHRVYRKLSRVSPSNRKSQWRTIWSDYLAELVVRIPPYLTVLLFVPLIPLLGSGPIWHDSVDPFVDKCRTTWWANLLFVNNFLRPENQCMFTSWMIGLDFQFYCLVPLLALLLLKRRLLGSSLLVLLSLVGMAATFLVTFKYNLPAIKIFTDLDPHSLSEYNFRVSQMPYTHLSSLTIGAGLAVFLLESRNKLLVGRMTTFVGYLISGAMMLLVIMCPYPWQNGVEPARYEAALYAAVSRPVWNLCLAWVVLTCATGKFPFLNRILSYPLFRPMSELTLSAYLINPLLMLTFSGLSRQPIYFAHVVAIYIFFAHCVTTYILSIVLSVSTEKPFQRLVQLYLDHNGAMPPRRTTSAAKGMGETWTTCPSLARLDSTVPITMAHSSSVASSDEFDDKCSSSSASSATSPHIPHQ